MEKQGRGKGRSVRTEHQHPQHMEPERTKQQWHSVKTLAVNHPKQQKARGSYQNGPNTPPGGHGATALSENQEVVDGVRRIWGTMRGCSYRTVLSTLQRLTTVAEKVEVRRKFKKRDSTEVRWWFLIRGEESVLQTLDQEWMNVENSTSWKLEHCYQPVSPSATDNLNGEGDNTQATMPPTPSEEDGESSFLSIH